MKRQLIEINQQYLIECDHCDYKIKNETGNPFTDIGAYIGEPCPECGENLLTQLDYEQSERVMNVIAWLNKWFSWLMIFVPKKTKSENIGLKFHNGIKITKEQ